MTASILLASGFLLLLAALYILSEPAAPLRFFYSPAAAVFSTAGFLVAVLGVGLNLWEPQSVVFISLFLFFLLTLGLKCLHAVAHGGRPWGATVIHFGLFLFAFSLAFGGLRMERYRLLAQPNIPEMRAVDLKSGQVCRLPIAVELQSFDIRYHEISDLNRLDQAVPRQYIARVKVHDYTVDPPRVREDSILVNRPLRVAGFHIYNTSFDPYGQGYVTFLLVKDPWRGATYAGIVLCLAGGLLLFIQKSRKRLQHDELA